jgi:hypothetical protein
MKILILITIIESLTVMFAIMYFYVDQQTLGSIHNSLEEGYKE